MLRHFDIKSTLLNIALCFILPMSSNSYLLCLLVTTCYFFLFNLLISLTPFGSPEVFLTKQLTLDKTNQNFMYTIIAEFCESKGLFSRWRRPGKDYGRVYLDPE